MTSPDVTVVVIGFNDAERIPRAIESIQRQTLRNLEIVVIDDASIDETAAVVRAMAAADSRIRYECLPANSGGCSAPRNRGVELARAPWVMFCDSDDEYDRHACKNLLLTAERLDAEVVCGAAERVDVRTGRVRPWRPELHDSLRIADGLEGFPELMADTISVNKIYSRALLEREAITFPEGLLFEDQLFTLEAMSAARRVAAIPQVVYRWYVDRLGEELSITQRHMEARNVDDRVEINRRIDAFLDARGLDAVRRFKDVKFLRHDLFVYLSAILDADDTTAILLMDRLRPYVSSLDPRLTWQVRTGLRVAIYHLLAGDAEGVRAAMRFVKWASVVDVRIEVRNDRQLWRSAQLAAGPAVGGIPVDEWLDVTDLHLLDVPFTQRRYLHRLETLEVADGRVVASGTSVDYDGGLADIESVELRFGSGPSQYALRLPGRWTEGEGLRRAWRAEGALEVGLGRPLDDRDWGMISLAVCRAGLVNITGCRSALVSAPDEVLAYPGSTTSRGPDAISLKPGDNGAVVWRALHTSGGRTSAAEERHSFWRDELLVPVLSRVGALLPARDVVLVDTSDARPANSELRAIAQALADDHPEIPQAWVHRGRPTRVPLTATPVERLSIRHHWLGARARWRLDDGTSTLGVRYRPSGATIRPLDGVPIHRIGLDDPTVLSERGLAKEVRRRAKRWTSVLTASQFAADVTETAFAKPTGALVVGSARLDATLRLTQAGSSAREELRRELDLPGDRAIVLYAPVGRTTGRAAVDPPLDLDLWASELGERAYLLVRAHPSEKFHVSTRHRYAIRDISDPDLVDPFLVTCDLVVSDYSSIIADAAALDRPIALFQPDYDSYVHRQHGLYVDLSAVGPRARSTSELIDLTREWLDDPRALETAYRDGRQGFVATHCGPLDAGSCQRAIAAILAVGR